VVSFHEYSLPKLCTHLSSPPYVPHAPLVSSFFWLTDKYLVRITDYEVSYYAVFSSPLLPRSCIYEIVIISRQEEVLFSYVYTGSSSVFESVPSAGWRELSHCCNVIGRKEKKWERNTSIEANGRKWKIDLLWIQLYFPVVFFFKYKHLYMIFSSV
jgi:hypothetical protein